MKTKLLVIGGVGLVLYGFVALIRWNPNANTEATSQNVSIVAGTQYIDLTAKGGYAPRKTLAQAGIPTILEVTTNGTYDCSSSINIPAVGVNQYLPPTGTTALSLQTPTVGTLQGTCSMGMYQFEIEFAS